MQKETLSRAFAAITLPVAAAIGVGCDTEQKDIIPTATIQSYEAPVTVFGGDEIIDQAVKKFGGAVVFSVVGYDKELNMTVKFDRLDVPAGQQQVVDHDTQYLTPAQAYNEGDPIYSLFAATSCDGKYRISVSLDGGKNFSALPVQDLSTGVPSTTFELPKDTCIMPVTLYLRSGLPNRS